jgi:hypothetical protein
MMTPCSPHVAPLLLAHQRSYPSHNPWGNAATLFTGRCCKVEWESAREFRDAQVGIKPRQCSLRGHVRE